MYESVTRLIPSMTKKIAKGDEKKIVGVAPEAQEEKGSRERGCGDCPEKEGGTHAPLSQISP